MTHYQPKTVTTTAAGTIAAASLADQILTALLVGAGIIALALVVRLFWRRKRQIGQ